MAPSQEIAALARELKQAFGNDRLLSDEPLAKYCNWKAGGPADLFLIVRSPAELADAVRLARAQRQPVTVIGFGANSLVSDRGIRGLVLLNRAERIIFHAGHKVEADSGVNLAVLARQAAVHETGGLEFLIGIPGTVGAAVYGNAGTREEWISSILLRALVLAPENTRKWLNNADLGFAYRSSRLQHSGEIVLSAELQGRPAPRAEIEARMQALLQARKNQPGGSSAGSVFKNPPGQFAGRLIEMCGLKGLQIGGAKISEKHGNFIINTGKATASEIKALIDRIKGEVLQKQGIRLQEEIQYLGEW